MSSTDTSPRSGAKKPKSAEEIGEQIDELRSQLQSLTSTITRTAGKQGQKHAGKPGDGDPGQSARRTQHCRRHRVSLCDDPAVTRAYLAFRLAADLPRDAVLRVAPFLGVPVFLSADERSAATRCPDALRFNPTSAKPLSFLSAAFSSRRLALRRLTTLSWSSSGADAISVRSAKSRNVRLPAHYR